MWLVYKYDPWDVKFSLGSSSSTKPDTLKEQGICRILQCLSWLWYPLFTHFLVASEGGRVSFSPFQLLPCVIILLKPLFLGICVCTSDSKEVKLTLLPEKHTAMTEFLLPSEFMCQEWDSWFWVIAIESILSQECYYTRFCKWLRTGRRTTSTVSQPPSVPTESTRKTPTVWHYLKSAWGCG